jgi:hypothetical protein
MYYVPLSIKARSLANAVFQGEPKPEPKTRGTPASVWSPSVFEKPPFPNVGFDKHLAAGAADIRKNGIGALTVK